MSRLRAHIIAVSPSITQPINEASLRYAVLTEAADHALAIVQGDLRFGTTAHLTGEVLPDDVVAALALVPKKPRLLE